MNEIHYDLNETPRKSWPLSTDIKRDVDWNSKQNKQSLDFGSQTGVENLMYGYYVERSCKQSAVKLAPSHFIVIHAMIRREEKWRMRGNRINILLKGEEQCLQGYLHICATLLDKSCSVCFDPVQQTGECLWSWNYLSSGQQQVENRFRTTSIRTI